jgi:hypothetical protein
MCKVTKCKVSLSKETFFSKCQETTVIQSYQDMQRQQEEQNACHQDCKVTILTYNNIYYINLYSLTKIGRGRRTSKTLLANQSRKSKTLVTATKTRQPHATATKLLQKVLLSFREH